MAKKVIIEVELDKNGSAKKGTDALATSIKGLREETKRLRAERDLLDISTDEGMGRASELNDLIDQNNKAIKANSSALEQQRLNVGNYKSSVEELNPGLTTLTGGIQKVNNAFKLLLANPVGFVLGALALTILAVKSAFEASEEGQNKWNKIMRVMGVIVGNVMDLLSDFGEVVIEAFENPIDSLKKFGGFVKDQVVNRFIGLLELIPNLGKAIKFLFEGELKKAGEVAANAMGKIAFGVENVVEKVDKAIDKTKELIKETEREIALAKQLADLEAATDLLARQQLTERVKLEAEIANLRNIAIEKDKRSLEEREAALRRAQVLNDQILDKEEKILANRLTIIKASNEFSKSNKDALDAAAEAERDLLLIQVERANKRKEVESELQGLIAERLALEKQIRDEIENDRIQRYQKELDRRKEEEENYKKFLSDRLTIFQKHLDTQNKREELATKKQADKLKQIEDKKNEALAGSIELLGEKQKAARFALSSIFKSDAIKETIISTKAMAVQAYKSLAGIPIVGPALGIAAAIAATAFGLSQVASITGISFARGGKVGTFGGRSHSEGGTHYYGTDGGHIEVEKGENFYVLKKSASKEINSLSALNTKHGGRPFGSDSTWFAEQGGRIETIQADLRNSISGSDISEIVKTTLQNTKIVTFVEDIGSALDVENEIQSKSNITG